ncbi:MAG TPA: hypothetical protein VF590_11150, partial [Isosphaeraceae bacterium]
PSPRPSPGGRGGKRSRAGVNVLLPLVILLGNPPQGLHAQSPEIERPGPPALETFETDANGDGVPDGWYNLRDAELVKGGPIGSGKMLRFRDERPSRAARVSRAFGVDGRAVEALVVGLWIRAEGIDTGERIGEDAGLLIDFLDEGLRSTARGTLGPWTRSLGSQWVRVARRIAVPATTRDAILTLGLLGATGTLEVDGLTIATVPRGGVETTNLVLNGDIEWGDPRPSSWLLEGKARRVHPGHRSDSALELTRAGARALLRLSAPPRRFERLSLTLAAAGASLRTGGGAVADLFFLDEDGRPLPGAAGRARVGHWVGSFDWRREPPVVVDVPEGAAGAVLQFEKADAAGTLRIDDVAIVAAPAAELGRWRPYHEREDTENWPPYEATAGIDAGSALDASPLLEAPAGRHGFVTVRQGRLAFEAGGRARFFGVALLPPMAFLDPIRADALADRLARSGINLVRLGDLDTPLGMGLSLFDDSRDDTRALDPAALAKLDHLIAALKARGIYVALELQSERRFRAGDGLAEARRMPPGGGPAAAFDPRIRELAVEAARALLAHVNAETGLALRDDPVLAWVTLAGELSLFDLIDDPDALPPDESEALKALARKATGTGRRFWEATEAAQWRAEAEALRALGVWVPIAGGSHWRREPEYVAAQGASGLDLIDDRLYWAPAPFGAPERRSLLWPRSGDLAAEAARKRKADRPYVVGQWCAQTRGAWALPYEGADLMRAAQTAGVEDWDALVRRGVFPFPEVWGAAAAGTGGGQDSFVAPEALNGIPQVIALLPHAASVVLRGEVGRTRSRSIPDPGPGAGRLLVDTPHTQGFAGRPGSRSVRFEALAIEAQGPFAVVMVSSLDPEPISRSRRLLVTAVGRAEPTGLTWADPWRDEAADPGRPPLLREPIRVKLGWKRRGKLSAYALDAAGRRGPAVALEETADGVRLALEGRQALHWELVVE